MTEPRHRDLVEDNDCPTPTHCNSCGEPTLAENHSYNGTTYGCTTCGNNLNSDNRTKYGLNHPDTVRRNMCQVIRSLRIQLEDAKTQLKRANDTKYVSKLDICGKGW